MNSMTKSRESMPKRPTDTPQTVPGEASLTEQIRARAFQIYQARRIGGIRGDSISDWLQAERELSGTAARPTAAPVVRSESSPRADAQVEALGATRGEVLLRNGR